VTAPLPSFSSRGRLGRLFRTVRSSGRFTRAFRPATKQIFARPADPLSVSLSYEIMRNGIGVLGLAFPIVLIVGGGVDHVQASLSAYYHFSRLHPGEYGAGTMRDVFVGMLCAIGAFLFFYRGHSFPEDIALNIAGVSAVLIALVPMDWPSPPPGHPVSMAANVHYLCAGLFFVMIAYVCVFRARDTLCIVKSPRRRRAFARIYLVFGILMLATPITVATLEFLGPFAGYRYSTMVIEVAGVLVFAAFWLIKGFEIRSSLQPVFALEHGDTGT